MNESDIREIVREEKFNTIMKSTCCVCGKIHNKNGLMIDCEHPICMDCAKSKILPYSKEKGENPSIYYQCRICNKRTTLKCISVDKFSHNINIIELFAKIYECPNFTNKVDPTTINIGNLNFY